MLSILIPIYNFDCSTLVAQLHQQCEAARITYEIICLDDASSPDFQEINSTIAHLQHVQYLTLATNVGRSKIRNQLAKMAKYPYLLFIDCDHKVIYDNYIQRYVAYLHPNKVLYGGTRYDDQPPQDSALHFRWYFGKSREMIPVHIRQSKPYHYFMTNNFLVPTNIFLQHPFNENLKQYGHEDTLFSQELAQQQIPIVHLDNTLEHLGLEPMDNFLKKSEQAIENLVMLTKQGVAIETRLSLTFKRLQSFGLAKFITYIFPFLEQPLLKKLAAYPSQLFYFDLWKLGKFSQYYYVRKMK